MLVDPVSSCHLVRRGGDAKVQSGHSLAGKEKNNKKICFSPYEIPLLVREKTANLVEWSWLPAGTDARLLEFDHLKKHGVLKLLAAQEKLSMTASNQHYD